MRAFLVLAVAMLGACGEGGGGTSVVPVNGNSREAPECAIPDVSCPPNAPMQVETNEGGTSTTTSCVDERGHAVRSWRVYLGGQTRYQADTDECLLWISCMDLAGLAVEESCTKAECWDDVGQPTDCQLVYASFRELSE